MEQAEAALLGELLSVSETLPVARTELLPPAPRVGLVSAVTPADAEAQSDALLLALGLAECEPAPVALEEKIGIAEGEPEAAAAVEKVAGAEGDPSCVRDKDAMAVAVMRPD